jgi:hypothetical protein
MPLIGKGMGESPPLELGALHLMRLLLFCDGVLLPWLSQKTSFG